MKVATTNVNLAMVVTANLVFKKVMVHAFASFQEHPDGHQIHGEHVLHGEDQVE
jgi:Mn2+/Fe2+ NRAMP family transporter